MSMGYMSLHQAAQRLNMCGKTLAAFLRANPTDPPLFAKPGRDYLISESDVARIYEAMKSSPREFPAVQPQDRPLSEKQIMDKLRKLTTNEHG